MCLSAGMALIGECVYVCVCVIDEYVFGSTC